jgi:hypothetical protein
MKERQLLQDLSNHANHQIAPIHQKYSLTMKEYQLLLVLFKYHHANNTV